MAYGTVKVDTIIFDNGGSDQSTTVSGFYRATTSGVTVSGTLGAAIISGVTVIGSTTVSGATVTGTTANFTSGNFSDLISAAATISGALIMANQQPVRFREAVGNGVNHIALQAPAAVSTDRVITLPDQTGTVVTTGDSGSVTSTMILDGTILNTDVNASAGIEFSKLANVSATDKLLGRSTAGAGAIEEITCTSAGRALIDDVNAAAQRTTLGLVIGTDVEAFDPTIVRQSRQLIAGTGLTGGGDLSADRTFTADVATQAEAEAGTSSAKLMTPQRTAQALLQLPAYTITTTAISKTLVNRERCTVTAASQTITLPTSPAVGSEVTVTIGDTFVDTIVARNGSNIMSLAEDITLDKAYVSVTLYYVDATRGWRII